MKRCDHLPILDANPGKIRALLDVLAAFRDAAPDVSADQWRRFFEEGRFRKMVSAAEEAPSPRLVRAKARIGVVRMQMLRYQVVGQLKSFIASRANDYCEMVVRSSLEDDVRHKLQTIGKADACFSREPVVMRSGARKGEEIAPEIRALVRSIMRAVLARHRRPRFHRLNSWIDQRQVEVIRKAANETGGAHTPLWVRIRGMYAAKGKNDRTLTTQVGIAVPLRSYHFFDERGGALAKRVQLIERPASAHTMKAGRSTHRLADGRPGKLVFGLVSAMEAAFTESRHTFQPAREEMALDFGLSTMFATPDGDLLGRAWFDQLRVHDERINGLARKLQRQGLRPSRSRSYRARVSAFRGFLKAEIGRVLNRLVMMKRPAHIIIEKLDFTAPGLSRRLNRILSRSGRSVIRAKLKDFEERFGITFSEVNPDYSSQTCSSCGFVAKGNRRSQSEFSCRSCGHEIHADVNAACNLESGCSAFDREARLTKAQSLEATVRRHLERLKTRDRVSPAVVLSSPYYKARSAAADASLTRILPPPDVVADVSEG